jgi:hypothetical protein
MAVKTKANETEGDLICLVWNTIKANRWALLNSIGELGNEQTQRAEKLLASSYFCEKPILHLMHHQVAVPDGSPTSKNLSLGKLNAAHTVGMGLQTAEHLFSFIRNRGQQTCILHGHHHKYFVCREEKSKTMVVSAPSSKFGTEVSFSKNVIASSKPNWLMLEMAINGVHLELVQVRPM